MNDIGKDRILFFDEKLINKQKTTAKYLLCKPEMKGICASFDEEWDKEATYFHIVKEKGFYRMYYAAFNRVDADGNLITLNYKPHLAAIESKDGITWTKPVYGLVEVNGSKENNLIDTEIFDAAFIYKDINPECPADEKYKALYMRFVEDTKTELWCAFSFDGLKFGNPRFITDEGTFDSLNLLFWDEKKKRYACYFRNFHNADGTDFTEFKDVLNAGNKAIRDVRVIYSKDFKTWTKPKRIAFNDGMDYQMYTNNIIPYVRSPRYYIGFPERYTEYKKWDVNFENLCSKSRRKSRMRFHPRLGLALTDQLFIASNDGENFFRSNEAFLTPGLERNGGWTYGSEKIAYGMTETEDAFGTGKEMSFYFPFANPEKSGTKLMRCSVRIDGFVCYSAAEKEKKVITNEFVFDGSRLFFNLSTSSVGYVQVTLKDFADNKITSKRIFGDSIEKEIFFEKGNVKDFAGNPVTMEIRLKESSVYSFRFE